MLLTSSKVLLRRVNTALAAIDSAFLSREDARVAPPLFIVGVPRSGTTLLYQIVTQEFRVGYFIEAMNYAYGMPNVIMRLVKSRIGRPAPIFESDYGKTRGFFAPAETGNFWFRWFPRDGPLGHYVEPRDADLDKYRSLKRNISSLARILNKPLVFKSVYLDMTVGILARLFPESRFLLIERDLLLTAQSLLIGRLRQPNPEDWWSVKPPQYEIIQTHPLWQQVVEQVFYTAQILQKDLLEYATGRYYWLDYYQLCHKPQQVVAELSAWLGPVQYETYDCLTTPSNFPYSDELKLPEELILKMRKHLEYLERQS